MKALFLGDISGVHATLASELRRRGHYAVVVSEGPCAGRTACDVRLERRPGTLGSLRYLQDAFTLLNEAQGYDVVQLASPRFLDFKPARLRYFLRMLSRQNGRVFLTLGSPDHFYVRAATDCRTFRFSEYRIGPDRTRYAAENRKAEEAWLCHRLEDYTRFIYDSVDGAVSLQYEYDLASRPVLGDRLTYAGLPVAADLIRSVPIRHEGVTNLLVRTEPGTEVQRGTDILLDTAYSLEAELGGKCRVIHLDDASDEEYLRSLETAHIVLDGLYSHSPSLSALQAMASGRACGCGAQPEYYGFIGERELRPALPLAPGDPSLRDRLRELILDPDRQAKMAADGLSFVRKHHDVATVADRFLRAWDPA